MEYSRAAYVLADRVVYASAALVGVGCLSGFIAVLVRDGADAFPAALIFFPVAGAFAWLACSSISALAGRITISDESFVYKSVFTQRAIRWEEVLEMQRIHFSRTFTSHLRVRTRDGREITLPCADGSLLETVVRIRIEQELAQGVAKPPQRNAGSPTSSDDSPASEALSL